MYLNKNKYKNYFFKILIYNYTLKYGKNMNPQKRRQARKLSVQTLYAWQISKNNSISEIKKYILKQNLNVKIDILYFHNIINGVINNIIYLDKLISLYINRKINTLDYIEKIILRISIYEMFKRSDIPNKVVINEGIELAKIFGSSKSHKFINGVLDKIISLKK